MKGVRFMSKKTIAKLGLLLLVILLMISSKSYAETFRSRVLNTSLGANINEDITRTF